MESDLRKRKAKRNRKKKNRIKISTISNDDRLLKQVIEAVFYHQVDWVMVVSGAEIDQKIN